MEKLEKKTKKELMELVESGIWYKRELEHMYNVIACNHVKIKEYKPLLNCFIKVNENLYLNYNVNEHGNIYVNANKVYRKFVYQLKPTLEKGFERISINAVDALANGFDVKLTILKLIKKTNSSIRVVNGNEVKNFMVIQDTKELQIFETKFINLSK